MPDPELTAAFRAAVLTRSGRGTLPCWFGANVEDVTRCEGRIEAAHVIGRQSIRNCHGLWRVDPDLLELAQWDVRNALPACTAHHRRFDNHATPGLSVPAAALPEAVVEFIFDWGLESEAERRFVNFVRR